MRTSANERCDFCGEIAVAFQRGASVCGRCGIQRTLDHSSSPMRSRRMVLVGLFSSGLLVKLMLGAVALAAVGSWAAATVMAPPPPIVISPTAPVAEATTSTTVAEGPALRDPPAASVEEVVSAAEDQAAKAHEFATATQNWANCVSTKAILHRGGEFSPWEACPGHPRLSDFGLSEGQGRPDIPPGWQNKPEDPSQASDHRSNDDEEAIDPSTQIAENGQSEHNQDESKQDQDENEQDQSDGDSSDDG